MGWSDSGRASELQGAQLFMKRLTSSMLFWKAVSEGFMVEKMPENVAITRPHMSADTIIRKVSTTVSLTLVAVMSP